MSRRRLVLVPLVVAGLSFGIAACGDDDESDDGGGGEDVSSASFDLQVGALLPLTGDLSAFGPAGEKAANLAIEEANAALEEAGADITVELECGRLADGAHRGSVGGQAADLRRRDAA